MGPEDNGTFTIGTPTISPAGFVGTITPAQNGVLSITSSGGQAGNYTVTVPITDNCNVMASATFTLRVNCPTITVTPPAVTTATAGQPFSATFTQTGGIGAVNFSTTAVSPTPTPNPTPGPSANAVTLTANIASMTVNTPGRVSPIVALGGLTGYAMLVQFDSPTKTFRLSLILSGSNLGLFTLPVACPGIALSPVSLPNATINTGYGQLLTATPAGGNYSFAVTSGLLPQGLLLDSDGDFSGVPTQSGTFNFRVTATGFGGCTAFRDYLLVVACMPVTLDQVSLANGTIGMVYNQAVSASPAGSYSYAVSSVALPPGLLLNPATGAIAGMPMTTGTFTFRITAANSGGGGCSGGRDYTVTIGCAEITLGLLPNGSAGVSYNQTIAASPAGDYTYSLQIGSLPPGLALNPSTGVISGFPTVLGIYNFSLRASSSTGCSGTESYSIVISCPAVTLAPASLPGGSTGVAYSQSLTASPSGSSYSYAITAGALPGGLSLNPTGLLSGTPTANGTFSFTVTVTGFGSCMESKYYSMTIATACPTITLPNLPNGNTGANYANSVAASPSGS